MPGTLSTYGITSDATFPSRGIPGAFTYNRSRSNFQSGTNIGTVAPTPETPSQRRGKIGDRLEAAGTALAVNGVRRADRLADFSAATDNVLLIVDVTLENVSREELPYTGPLNFKVKDEAGDTYISVLFPSPPPNYIQIAGFLARGEKVRGEIAFEVPASGKGFALHFKQLESLAEPEGLFVVALE